MSPKFTGAPTVKKPPVASPLRTKRATVPTYEGGRGFQRDEKSELFLLVVTDFVEQTFYERIDDRNQRLTNLVQKLSRQGEWEWLYHLTVYARQKANLRSISVVLACEYAKARLEYGREGNNAGPTARALVDAICVRADEPAEVVGYWAEKYGSRNSSGRIRPQLPMAVKRGLADAVRRLYDERNVLKYNAQSHAIRMADVLELTHPAPASPQQEELFGYLLDRRHGHKTRAYERLDRINLYNALYAMPVEKRRAELEAWTRQGTVDEKLKAAGMTWESLSGWLNGPMDAQAWGAVIPLLGYMALLRNLRNFLAANVSPEILARVAERIADPQAVARSRQLPIRFYNAYMAAGGERPAATRYGYRGGGAGTTEPTTFAEPLARALELSLRNVPRFDGKTVVLIDVSGSMDAPLSARSEAMRFEYAALFGLALANTSGDVHVYPYSDGLQRELPRFGSIFEGVRYVVENTQHGGTRTWESAQDAVSQHHPDRLVILTDEQPHDSSGDLGCLLYTFNLAGYRAAHAQSGPRSFTVGGLSDAAFVMMKAIEEGLAGRWPWEYDLGLDDREE